MMSLTDHTVLSSVPPGPASASSRPRDFVIIGLQQWYTDIGSNCKSIALELARHHRVLYINMPLDRRTALKQKHDPNVARHLAMRQGREDNLVSIAPNLWNYYPRCMLESINWIPFTPLFSLLNRVNNRRFAAELRTVINRMGFSDYVLFNDNDIFRSCYLKEYLAPPLYVYYSRDNLLGIDYWRRHGRTVEPQHIARADLGVANSVYLARYLQQHNPNVRYIGQGCDISLFDPDRAYETPADLASLPRPLIGYVGAITSLRIDEAVIRTIARAFPEGSVVLVGPEDEFFTKSDLHGLPNVHFLGKRPLPSLPAYLAQFDVCINPQLINPITIGNYPLKLDEYLAMGKPAVVTRTEAVEIFGDLVYRADRPEDYPGLIRQALAETDQGLRAERIRLARSHTWAASVEALLDAIEQTVRK